MQLISQAIVYNQDLAIIKSKKQWFNKNSGWFLKIPTPWIDGSVKDIPNEKSSSLGGVAYYGFVIGTLPFLTVDATISNQNFSHDRCTTFPGLSYKKANNRSSNSVRKNAVGAQVEFLLKFMERARVTCYWCKVKKDSLSRYVLNFFRNFCWSANCGGVQ